MHPAWLNFMITLSLGPNNMTLRYHIIHVFRQQLLLLVLMMSDVDDAGRRARPKAVRWGETAGSHS